MKSTEGLPAKYYKDKWNCMKCRNVFVLKSGSTMNLNGSMSMDLQYERNLLRNIELLPHETP